MKKSVIAMMPFFLAVLIAASIAALSGPIKPSSGPSIGVGLAPIDGSWIGALAGFAIIALIVSVFLAERDRYNRRRK